MIGEKCGVGGHDFMSNRDLLDVKVEHLRSSVSKQLHVIISFIKYFDSSLAVPWCGRN